MIRTETFTIEGNQENKVGNPLPYLRRTQGSLWSKESKRYEAWIEFVRRQCYFQTTLEERWNTRGRTMRYEHPFTTSRNEYARMDVMMWFADETHADPDNIFKGLADALFKNDKHLAHSVDFGHASDGRGRVDIIITISQAPDLVAPARKRKEKKGLVKPLY